MTAAGHRADEVRSVPTPFEGADRITTAAV
jgi:hypothetical protein